VRLVTKLTDYKTRSVVRSR